MYSPVGLTLSAQYILMVVYICGKIDIIIAVAIIRKNEEFTLAHDLIVKNPSYNSGTM